MTTQVSHHDTSGAHDGHDHGDHKPTGFLDRWLFTTNHKDIGTLYLVFSLTMFLIGGAMAMVIRAELFMPGLQLVEPDFFNQMTTMHALIMVFGAVMPAWVGFANWLVPMMIGAPDMALFSRLRSRCCYPPCSWIPADLLQAGLFIRRWFCKQAPVSHSWFLLFT